MTASTVRPAVFGLLLWPALAAETSLAQEARSDPPPVRDCEGAVITRVFVDNHSIYDAPEPDTSGAAGLVLRFSNWARSVANRLHRRTRPSFIERELLFKAGDCLEPLMLDESERLLRALPFIAEADVYTVPIGGDEVHVVVDTRDDWTLKLDVRGDWDDRLRLTHVGLTEENLWGTGTLIGFYLSERDEKRDLGGQFRTEQFAGTRLDAHVSGGRTRTGVFFTESVSYPFVGEVGQWAFVESFALREDLFPYAAPAGSSFTNASLPIQTRYGEATLGRRFGTPGDLTVLAGGVSWEDVRFDGFPGGVEVVSGFDFSVRDTADSATIEAIRPQVAARKSGYLNILAGKRNVRFITRRGLDAIRGVQDVRVGTQALVALGTSFRRQWASPAAAGREIRGKVSLFAGSARSNWVFNTELNLEGARSFGDGSDGGNFRDVLGEFDAYFYWHPVTSGRHTFVAGLSGAGGWRNTLPFQLTVGGPHGIRGYDREDFPAAQRLVVNLEDRIRLDGPFPDLFDLGLVLFIDAGAGWSGDVPFGTDSGLRTSAGVGVRVALPAGARQVWRLDVAAPLECRSVQCVQVRAGADLVSLLTGFDDRQVRRSRAASPAAAFLGSR
ncbi:MAG: BamA/TamA family outer membrane protein [Gemmatimonadetes bacterium]|nr:BamA/TamA family outer membrane protein [Gemmatimonadota bacterium]MYG35249.1 BamA/TamA family outer membrane protein [Gemmatimonadota bacterium]